MSTVPNSDPFAGIARAYSFKLGLLTGIDDFKNLFKQYRVGMIKLTITPCAYGIPNAITSGTSTVSPFANNTAVRVTTQKCWWDQPAAESMTSQYVAESQSCKTRMLVGRRPLTYIIRPKESTEVQGIVTSTDVPAMSKSRWHSLTDTGLDAKLSGLNVRIDRVDGQGLGAGLATLGEQKVRIETKFYFQCRQVH